MIFSKARRNGASSSDAGEPADPQVNPAAEDPLPLANYEGLDDHDIRSKLSEHSQDELATIETFERSHKKRPVVLDKLRYLRGPEPLPDYDTLSVEAISAAIGTEDVETLKRVRVYERKFQQRPKVLELLADTLREQRPAGNHRP